MITNLGIEIQQAFPQVWSVNCHAEELRPALAAMNTQLADDELDQITFHLTPVGCEPTPSKLMHSRNIRELIAWSEGLWVGDLISSGKLMTYFQPIVVNSRPHQVFAYECLLRAVDQHGQIIRPDRLITRLGKAVDWSGWITRHASRPSTQPPSVDSKPACL